MAQKQQFMIRLPEEALARLGEIAEQNGFTDGRSHDGLNLAEAARLLLGQADAKMFAVLNDVPYVEPPVLEQLGSCPECGDPLELDEHEDGHTGPFCDSCGWRG